MMTIKRSTCQICGWYLDYETKRGAHNWVDEVIHLSDYTEYTNELDAYLSECTICGEKSVWYDKGEGFYYPKVSDGYSVTVSGFDEFEYAVTSDDFRLLEHPKWQRVYRNFVYNAEGYVIQFDYIYCTNTGERYVCTVDSSDIPGMFGAGGPNLKEYEGMNYHLTYKLLAYGTEVSPNGWHIGWSG